MFGEEMPPSLSDCGHYPDAISDLPDIPLPLHQQKWGHNHRISCKPYAFLLRLGIIKGTDVDVHRYQVAMAGGDHRGKSSYYPSRFLQNDVVEATLGAARCLRVGLDGTKSRPSD